MEPSPLSHLTVAEGLDRWPQIIPVFLRHRMACVGCAMAPFEDAGRGGHDLQPATGPVS